MQLLVRGVHIDVDDALRDFVEVHVHRALDRILAQDPVQLEVHLVEENGGKGGQDQTCRLTLHVPGHPALHIEEGSDDIHKAVVVASERLERAAKKYVDKRHHHAGGTSLADLPGEEG